jgi:Bacteriocin-protection, YdeI or OmpD-Associated/Domain of unknown function (DUF1905)
MPTYTPGPVEGVPAPRRTAPPFTATIYRLEDINLAIDAPAEVSEWFGRNNYIPVYGRLDAITIRANLVPTGAGRHRIYLNRPMREATDRSEGDEVHVTLWLDEDPRDVDIPSDLQQALVVAGALDGFLSWPPSHQREHIRAVESVKRPETRARTIERSVAAALEHPRSGP